MTGGIWADSQASSELSSNSLSKGYRPIIFAKAHLGRQFFPAEKLQGARELEGFTLQIHSWLFLPFSASP